MKKHDTAATAETADASATQPEQKKRGRQPMTEAQKLDRRVPKGLKEFATAQSFTDPQSWASLPPDVLAKVEAAIHTVRTVIHKQEADALRARLAALEAADKPE